MVGAPFQFLEPSVTTKGNPVDHGMDEGVLRGSCGELSKVVKHAVRDHVLAFR